MLRSKRKDLTNTISLVCKEFQGYCITKRGKCIGSELLTHFPFPNVLSVSWNRALDCLLIYPNIGTLNTLLQLIGNPNEVVRSVKVVLLILSVPSEEGIHASVQVNTDVLVCTDQCLFQDDKAAVTKASFTSRTQSERLLAVLL